MSANADQRLLELGGGSADPGDVTLASYGAVAGAYAVCNLVPYPEVVPFLDQLAAIAEGGHADTKRGSSISAPIYSGGLYDASLANAVLLHLTPTQLADAFQQATDRHPGRGLLAFTLKEGDGAGWSTAKVARPRYFTYWRADSLGPILAASGWTVQSHERGGGGTEDWLHVIAR